MTLFTHNSESRKSRCIRQCPQTECSLHGWARGQTACTHAREPQHLPPRPHHRLTCFKGPATQSQLPGADCHPDSEDNIKARSSVASVVFHRKPGAAGKTRDVGNHGGPGEVKVPIPSVLIVDQFVSGQPATLGTALDTQEPQTCFSFVRIENPMNLISLKGFVLLPLGG